MKKLLILISASLATNACLALPTAQSKAVVLTKQNARVMEVVELNSHHEVTITNDVDGVKMFYFKFTLCPVDQLSRCVIRNDKIGLTRGQRYNYKYDLKTSVMFQAAGEHNIYATTEVTGAALSTDSNNSTIWAFY